MVLAVRVILDGKGGREAAGQLSGRAHVVASDNKARKAKRRETSSDECTASVG